MRQLRVLASPDKFRGTATAREVATAMLNGARDAGAEGFELPLADGGEGMLDAFGGPNRVDVVRGPNGRPVEAEWRLDSTTGIAVIESALASGLLLAGGRAVNDPIGSSTYGTGELIARAIEEGSRRVIVGVGGSATTDGGAGALEALRDKVPFARSTKAEVVVCCDVDTRFEAAAQIFAPQKGANPDQVEKLANRLRTTALALIDRFGVDVRDWRGSGAAGGLAGGLAAAGATLTSGFALVAEELGLREAIGNANLVITGEGKLDAESFAGKVVGGVYDVSRAVGVPVLVVAGVADDPPLPIEGIDVVALGATFGMEASTTRTTELVREVVRRHVVGLLTPSPTPLHMARPVQPEQQ